METLDSSIFDLTPIPMWIEDFSEVKQLFDLWRNQGVENLYEFLSQNGFVAQRFEMQSAPN